MAIKEPENLWEVSEQLKYNEPLWDPHDPRYVDTSPGRALGYERLFKSLGMDSQTDTLKVRHARQYHLFCGHRGSGKSTELRRLKERLNKENLFRVIFLDVLEDLDVNSLQYPDVCLALARRLLNELKEADGIVIDPVFLSPLENWFKERVLTQSKFKELKAGIEAGSETEAGIPFLTKLFANITGSFQVGSDVKDEIRTVFKSAYSEFATAFNSLLMHVEERMKTAWKASRLLFIIDGTDRLDQDDSAAFFVEDVHQLQQIKGLFIYCAPIHLIYTANSVQQVFDHICKIPALKLHEKTNPALNPKPAFIEDTLTVLRQVVLKRAPAKLFSPDPKLTGDWEVVDYLICHSGGHLRDLLRLLDYAFEHSLSDKYDMEAAKKAVKSLASDYRRFLQPDEFQRLAEIDTRGPEFAPND
ncbi:MAG TPA: hypothetical protein VD994_11205, partial [Prosthecobacter sp.]|nr:hypothetical protein [Prosthecobacter sp.]